MIISIICIDLLLCTFKTWHKHDLLLITMVTDYINQLRKPEDHWSCIAHLSAEDMLN